MSATKGAYLLLIRLKHSCDLAYGKRTAHLSPGLYGYCGSAYGPGGLLARVSRHARADKKPHWHVDRLLAAGELIKIGIVENGSECQIRTSLQEQRGASVPAPGFGSSDCGDCPSHLIGLKRIPKLGDIGLTNFNISNEAKP